MLRTKKHIICANDPFAVNMYYSTPWPVSPLALMVLKWRIWRRSGSGLLLRNWQD